MAPAVLAGAYWATPMLVTSLAGHNAAAVTIAQLDLPADVVKPAPKAADAAKREVDYSAFGSLAANDNKPVLKAKSVLPAVHVPMVFTLQSILMTGENGVAVVNGNLVRQGDKVGDGYRVVKVEPDAVWLGIRRTTSVQVGKKFVEQTKDELKVLHFPELRDDDVPTTTLAANAAPKSGTQVPETPEQKAGQIELEKNYKQILEMLKL